MLASAQRCTDDACDGRYTLLLVLVRWVHRALHLVFSAYFEYLHTSSHNEQPCSRLCSSCALYRDLSNLHRLNPIQVLNYFLNVVRFLCINA